MRLDLDTFLCFDAVLLPPFIPRTSANGLGDAGAGSAEGTCNGVGTGGSIGIGAGGAEGAGAGTGTGTGTGTGGTVSSALQNFENVKSGLLYHSISFASNIGFPS